MNENTFEQHYDVQTEDRSALLGQRGCVVWFSGLSGAGKSTLANALENYLLSQKRLSFVLDGDNVRRGLCADLDFSQEGRVENLRRVAQVAKLFADAGTVCLSAFISPLIASRQLARSIIGEDRFMEIYVSTSLAVCEQRDTKGLYKKARAGEVKNFTGISSPFEAPLNPDIAIDTEQTSVAEAVTQIASLLESRSIFDV